MILLPLLFHKAKNLKRLTTWCLSWASRGSQLDCLRPSIYNPCPIASLQLFSLSRLHCVPQRLVVKVDMSGKCYLSPLWTLETLGILFQVDLQNKSEKQCLSFLKQFICGYSTKQYQLCTNTLYQACTTGGPQACGPGRL